MTNLVSPQESAWQRGSKLSRSLGSFYNLTFALYVFILLVSVGGLWLGMEAARGSNAAALTIYGVGAIATLLMMAGAAIFLRAIRSAKEAVGTVSDYVQQGRGLNPGKIDSFVKWLTIWQWLAVVGAVLGGLSGFASNMLSGVLGGLDKDNSSLSMAVGLMTGVGSIISSVIQVVLTWLILAAIKEFFKAVMRHATGEPLLVSPFAQKAGNWLLFTLIILILGTLISGFGYLGLIAAVMVPNLLASGRGHGGFHIPLWLNLLAILPIILLAAAQIWQIVLVAWSGGFAKDVGSALDQNRNPGGINTADPWAGAVMEQQH